MRLYQDGALIQETTVNLPVLSYTIDNTIGAQRDSSIPLVVNLLYGVIDEVNIYNLALSAAELRRMYVLSQVKFWHKRQSAL